ncbi:MAG: hypothetical protein Q8L14_26035 [Myxococcales bacterium]|nr:hypothetical protein [Myxococcales bacterium]
MKVSSPSARAIGPIKSSSGATTAAVAKPTSPARYGDSFFAANELANAARRMTRLLGESAPLKGSFGAANQWSTIDQAAQPAKPEADQKKKA